MGERNLTPHYAVWPTVWREHNPIGAYSRRTPAPSFDPVVFKRMPNGPQFLFLASFLSVSILLFSAHYYIGTWLRDAGYDPSNLILIGLQRTNSSSSSESARHVNGTTIMSSSLLNIQENQLTQILAIALALASGALIYFKFGSGSKSYRVHNRRMPFNPLPQQRGNLSSTLKNGKNSL